MFLDRVRWTPVHCAAFYGRVEMLDLLIQEKDADVELRDKTYGGTALAWATFGSQPDAAKQLVQVHHANRFVRNRQAQTPFDLVPDMDEAPWKDMKLVLTRETVDMLADATEIYEILVSNVERRYVRFFCRRWWWLADRSSLMLLSPHCLPHPSTHLSTHLSTIVAVDDAVKCSWNCRLVKIILITSKSSRIPCRSVKCKIASTRDSTSHWMPLKRTSWPFSKTRWSTTRRILWFTRMPSF